MRAVLVGGPFDLATVEVPDDRYVDLLFAEVPTPSANLDAWDPIPHLTQHRYRMVGPPTYHRNATATAIWTHQGSS